MSERRAPLFPDPTSDAPTPVAATAEETDPLLESPTSPLRVLITGGTGFVGRHLIPRLLGRGHQVRVLSRNPDGASPLFGPNVETLHGDVTEAASLDKAADGCDIVVHLVPPVITSSRGRHSGGYSPGTDNVLKTAEAAGIRRFVYVSALGAAPSSDGYLRTKFYAEGEVLQSGLEHVVVRPSIIYGPGDHFTTAFVRLLRGSPVVPMAGRDSLVSEPISIEDAAEALSQAVERVDLANRTYELVGPQRLPLPRILRILARRLGVGCQIFNMPRWAHQPVTRLLQTRAGLDEGVLAMLRSGAISHAGAEPLRKVFRIEPLPFRHVVADYL